MNCRYPNKEMIFVWAQAKARPQRTINKKSGVISHCLTIPRIVIKNSVYPQD